MKVNSLCNIGAVSENMFQQDGALAHRFRLTVDNLQANVPGLLWTRKLASQQSRYKSSKLVNHGSFTAACLLTEDLGTQNIWRKIWHPVRNKSARIWLIQQQGNSGYNGYSSYWQTCSTLLWITKPATYTCRAFSLPMLCSKLQVTK